MQHHFLPVLHCCLKFNHYRKIMLDKWMMLKSTRAHTTMVGKKLWTMKTSPGSLALNPTSFTPSTKTRTSSGMYKTELPGSNYCRLEFWTLDRPEHVANCKVSHIFLWNFEVTVPKFRFWTIWYSRCFIFTFLRH